MIDRAVRYRRSGYTLASSPRFAQLLPAAGPENFSALFFQDAVGLFGPNGAGKTTLIHTLLGFHPPSSGSARVLGHDVRRDLRSTRALIGYMPERDSFIAGMTAVRFVRMMAELSGLPRAKALERTHEALYSVGLGEVRYRTLETYSLGMKQRAKLAQALVHGPRLLFLDEPLNGLDPMARAEVTDLFRELAEQGCFLIISSHILHEVDVLADRVALLDGGYVVAEGEVDEVRLEMEEHPVQVLVRCNKAKQVASALFLQDHLVEVLLNDDGQGFLARTRKAGHFYQQLQEIVLSLEVDVRKVRLADSDVRVVYQYLIEGERGVG